ncbi:hypothetical protein ASF88_02725 [Leifsonia sp. Leaf336]|uniref:hypothetical protein n=1 Tax=Leifsonia sp. Leaf336 TaxID=1736341 RepID=UPI0006F65981|nr:hypothetical protein [Leifsonia sp. Leaf336]KQR53784.1 hypothetical protein ASF88_02725 [Leifsonia sp. Leaf336]
MDAAPNDATPNDAPPRRARYAYWLLASVPFALVLDVCLTGLADFAWCGLNSCLYPTSPAESRMSLLAAVPLLFGILLLTFLALALPPWTPGWKRPAIAGAVGLLAVGAATIVVFSH